MDVKSEAHRLLHGTIEWVLTSPPAITAIALSKALDIDVKLAKGLISRLEKDDILGPHQGKKGHFCVELVT